MQVTQNDLEQAFNSSELPLLGYTFDAAINTHALALCLIRLAQRKPKQPKPAKPTREYWYQKI